MSYCQMCALRDDEIRTLKSRLAAMEAALGDVTDSLRKVMIHTGHFPDAPRDLLVGLLVSCARNAKSGLDRLDALLKGGDR